ncbi:MAG: hypothetical protein OHK0039_36100 [Bacteroidia bacterium]
MFKRFSNRQLMIALGVIAGLYLLTFAFGGRRERSFRATISSLDTAQVSSLRIEPALGGEVRLDRKGSTWEVKLPNGTGAATAAGVVARALGQIGRLEARQLVSRKRDDWAAYQVDSSGTRVQVLADDKTVLDLVIGRFAYQGSSMSTYVRLHDEDEVYAVGAFLESEFNRKADDWRDRTLIRGNRSEWRSLAFRYPADSSYTLLQDLGGNWILADSSSLDNTAVNTYLNSLANTRGTTFADASPTGSTPLMELLIQTTGGTPIEVKAYEGPRGALLLSSQNPGVFFSDESGDLMRRIFVGKGRFVGGS